MESVMSRLLSKDEIFIKLIKIICEALRIEESRIKWAAKVFLDLQAESLDVIDIRFRIEQDFGLKIEDREIVNSIGKDLSSEEITEKLTVGHIVGFIRRKLEQPNS
jgi:acyl carrier protein